MHEQNLIWKISFPTKTYFFSNFCYKSHFIFSKIIVKEFRSEIGFKGNRILVQWRLSDEIKRECIDMACCLDCIFSIKKVQEKEIDIFNGYIGTVLLREEYIILSAISQLLLLKRLD